MSHIFVEKKSELVQEERKMSRFQESYYFSAEREIASDCDLWDKVLSLFLRDAISHGTFITCQSYITSAVAFWLF